MERAGKFGLSNCSGATASLQERPGILVGVRVRPPLPREVLPGAVVRLGVAVAEQCVLVSKSDKPVVINSDRPLDSADVAGFRFDRVLGPAASQEEVYQLINPVVQSAAAGVNGTVFAYGQTGSGKTYTMGEHWSGPGRGVVPRAVDQLVGQLGPADLLQLTCLQLYGEQLTDLLHPTTPPVRLRESPGGGVFVEGASVEPIGEAADAAELLGRAYSRRATGATEMNQLSSRSHLITSFTVETGNLESRRVAQLHLVDLAGSERIKRSGATGNRAAEACAINSSLQFLAEVVSKLVSKQRVSHIPYRNCTLTRLLSNSLGGNCRTVLLATVSSSFDSASESIATLRFARSFSSVKNKPIVNLIKPRSTLPPNTRPKPKPNPRSEPRTMPWESIQLDELGGPRPVQTPLGTLSVRVYGDVANQPVAVFLHGYPSCSEEYSWCFGPLISSGFAVVAPDMPGCGLSTGVHMINGGEHKSARSEFNLDKGGAVDIVAAVLEALGVHNATMVGSDWGAGIAISLALRSQLRSTLP